jgi:signal peptidase I
MNEESHKEEPRRVANELWEIAKVIGISLILAFSIRYFIAQPFIVRGASMEPSFEDQEYLVIDEVTFYFREPERGEVVVFRYPRDPRQFFIKRIIGLPGEKIEITGGRVKIFNDQNKKGFVLEEPYLDPPGRLTRPDLSTTLGRDEYFVLGDNRDFSSDSRIWGVLKRKLITGRAVFRAWPVERLGILER